MKIWMIGMEPQGCWMFTSGAASKPVDCDSWTRYLRAACGSCLGLPGCEHTEAELGDGHVTCELLHVHLCDYKAEDHTEHNPVDRQRSVDLHVGGITEHVVEYLAVSTEYACCWMFMSVATCNGKGDR